MFMLILHLIQKGLPTCTTWFSDQASEEIWGRAPLSATFTLIGTISSISYYSFSLKYLKWRYIFYRKLNNLKMYMQKEVYRKHFKLTFKLDVKTQILYFFHTGYSILIRQLKMKEFNWSTKTKPRLNRHQTAT